MNILNYFYPTVPLRAKLLGFFQKTNKGEPPATLNYIGGAAYSTGNNTLQHLINYGNLHPNDSVLDIGCGVGRVALPLMSYLNSEASYQGFDIVKSGIDWCNENINLPNFGFTHIDVFNLLYNPRGKISGKDFTFSYSDSSFTFVFANSVFTHMLPENVNRYLSEIFRVSKVGMRGYLTFFLLNEDVIKRMQEGKTAHKFPHAFAGYRTLRKFLGREGVVAYDEPFIISMIEKTGLKVKSISYGSWSVDNSTFSDENKLLQDVVLVEKL